MATTPTLERFTEELIEILPKQTETEQRIGVGLHRRLAEGSPVDVAELASDIGLTTQQVAETLDQMVGVYRDGAERVVGYFGLTIREFGDHRVQVGGRTLWAWCAWDTLFIPQTLDRAVEVTSKSPGGGVPISLTATPDGPRDLSPAETVVSFVPIKSDFVENTIASFCHYVHFFPSAEAAESWTAKVPGAFTLPVEDAYRLARVLVEESFGDVITARPE